ncbi:hypothetical protein QFC21_006914 [Naganishia friedmannii]|uniref:Uncharacterized protein n=1 Tax=Naganishia friedmannii TaxID=89922 RepID=A0ACC2UZ56_9TREE|nr:hypothetical protein QFC21_006914 [Naganishia friedmannii]
MSKLSAPKFCPYPLAPLTSSGTITGKDTIKKQEIENLENQSIPYGLLEKPNTLGESDQGKSHMPEMERPERDSGMSSLMGSRPGVEPNALSSCTSKTPYIWLSSTCLSKTETSPRMTRYKVLPLVDFGSTLSEHNIQEGATNALQVHQDRIIEPVPTSAGQIMEPRDPKHLLSNISNRLQASENEEGEIEPSPQAGLLGSFKRDPRARRKQQSVRFCSKPPLEGVALRQCEYDRTSHPVVVRLTYREMVELREMKIDMGIVTKRQVVAGGSVGNTLSDQSHKRNTPRARPLSESALCARFNTGDGTASERLGSGADTDGATSTAYITRASEFPSSPRLLSRLRDMGEPRPPARGSGFGASVEPKFGFDKAMDYDSPPPIRDSTRRLARKVGGDFAVEESEFQKELRKARAELETIEVKEVREKIKSHGLAT